MIVLFVLLASLVAFRGLGAVGMPMFVTWQDSSRYALAVMFLFTSSAHFTKMKYDLAKMVPKGLPQPLMLIYFTGICEILGAVGILLTRFRSLAGSCLVLLLIVLFPANIKAAREGISLRGKPATPLWMRAPMQILFIVLT